MQIIKTTELISTNNQYFGVLLLGACLLMIFGIFGTALGLVLAKDKSKKMRILGRILTVLGVAAELTFVVTAVYYSDKNNTITQYTAIVSDVDSISENNYTVVEHVKDDVYLLIKK